jgi:hypothetical protein
VCNRSKHNQRGGAALQPLGFLAYPWEIVGINYVIHLPKSGSYGHTIVFIMVCHLTKMDHFVPCYKDIIAEELTCLFSCYCYRLHDVPKVIVSDRDHKIVGNFRESFKGILNNNCI